MGNCDVNLHDDPHPKKSDFPFLKRSIPNPFGYSNWHSDIYRASPHQLVQAASEQFEKSGLVAMQEAALHDSMVLEMGYQIADCDSNMILSDKELLKGSHVFPTLGNTVDDGKDHKALRPISLKELKVGKVHRGRTLSGTLCCRTVKTSVVMNVLQEDGLNNATRLVISNSLLKGLTTAKSQLLYPKGAKISVQDPYLKLFADGMVGLLVENPADIIFKFLPKEVPPTEKKNSKEASQGMAGKVESRHEQDNRQESHGQVTRCVDQCRWGSQIARQSASDKAHPECLRKILSREHSDVGIDGKSSSARQSGLEEPSLAQKSITGVGTSTNKHTVEIEELATPPQDVLDSYINCNSQSVLKEESSLHNVAEDNRQSDELHERSDTEMLLGCVHIQIAVPQNLGDQFGCVRPSEHDCEGQDNNHTQETDIIRNVEETNKVTPTDIITPGIEASLDYTKDILADDSFEMHHVVQGIGDFNVEVGEASHEKGAGNTQNVILNTTNEGGQFSPSMTLVEKDNQHLNPSRLERNDASGTIADNHLSPVALRLLGNKHFAQQNWAKAIDLYTQATFKAIQDSVQESKENLSPKHEKIVAEPQKDSSPQKDEQGREVVMDYSNRAEAWLRLHQYDRAWADAERALSFDPNHLKSLFRKGRALLGLGDYRQALAHFEAAHARTPFDKDVLAAIKLGRIADHQNRLGIYDLTEYYLRGRFAAEVPHCADYIGPVQVKADVGDKGRGLFLTKSVKAGDLLLVSNPLAFWQLENQGRNKSKLTNILCKESTTQDGNPRVPAEIKEKLVEILLERAQVSSKNCQRLLALCHCQQGVSHQPAPSMDLFISGRQISAPKEHIETEVLDELRLHKVIDQNAIDGNMVSTTPARRHAFHQENDDDNSKTLFYGLWVLPSFINHSCIPNVSLVLIGKNIFVYASKDMQVGEELQCSYFNVFQPLLQRRELAARCWVFSCKCARCLLETKFESSLEMLQSLHMQVQPYPTFSMGHPPPRISIPAKDIAKELQILESVEKLGHPEPSWLQASFTQLYIIGQDITGARGNCPLLYTALCAMEAVCPGNTSTLTVGLLCRANAERDSNGKKTSKYKAINQQLLRICKCIFGKHRTTVLQSLVEGFPIQHALNEMHSCSCKRHGL